MIFTRKRMMRKLMRKLAKSNKLQTQILHQSIMSDSKYKDPKRLTKYGYSLYSQNDEDGFIQEIFQRIGTTNKVFVEFGAGDGIENNTVLLLTQGWKGLWMEGSDELTKKIQDFYKKPIAEGQLKFQQVYITIDNIDQVISSHIPEKEIDLLSVDLDGNDYHIFNAINCISPRVIVVEYNPHFPPPVHWVMEYNENHQWNGSHYYGVSLEAYVSLMKNKGYSLVGCNMSGVNAFFVRNDLLADKFSSPYTARHHYEPWRHEIIIDSWDRGYRGFDPRMILQQFNEHASQAKPSTKEDIMSSTAPEGSSK